MNTFDLTNHAVIYLNRPIEVFQEILDKKMTKTVIN